MPSYVSFGRKYEVTLFEALDGSLKVDPKPSISDPIHVTFNYSVAPFAFNSATFSFYNLNPETVAKLSTDQKRGLIFTCWYEGGNLNKTDASPKQIIFQGLIFKTTTYRQGTDLITEVVCYDTIFKLSKPRAALTFPANTTSIKILNNSLDNYKASLKIKGKQYLTVIYKNPTAFINISLDDILKNLAADNGCLFHISGDTLTFFPTDDSKKSQSSVKSPIIISPKTGMVGNVRAEKLSVQLLPIDYFSSKDLNKNRPLVTVTSLLRKVDLFDHVTLKDT